MTPPWSSSMIVTVVSQVPGAEAGSQPEGSNTAVSGVRPCRRTLKVSLGSTALSLMIGTMIVRVVMGAARVAAGSVSAPVTAV